MSDGYWADHPVPDEQSWISEAFDAAAGTDAGEALYAEVNGVPTDTIVMGGRQIRLQPAVSRQSVKVGGMRIYL